MLTLISLVTGPEYEVTAFVALTVGMLSVAVEAVLFRTIANRSRGSDDYGCVVWYHRRDNQPEQRKKSPPALPSSAPGKRVDQPRRAGQPRLF